ncbi:integrase core domain-containing protein [Streptomyces massasporeus]|uniref:integrase core domain-containing protein n=1 Tax=Streptomyces massasporeus TaxID=67324 RepID=UPI00378A4C1A
MAEALNVTFKAELIEHQGPWHDADQVERAVVQWDGWYNTERLHSALDYLPPEEFEAAYYRSTTTPNAVWNTQDRPLRNPRQLSHGRTRCAGPPGRRPGRRRRARQPAPYPAGRGGRDWWRVRQR